MSTPCETTNLKSFDGFETIQTKRYFPDRYKILEGIFKEPGFYSPQGANLSYAALSFGASSSVVKMTQFDRFLAFDETLGIIEVEAGMTLGTLAQFSIPKGWYLKVQPGHPSITIGGCIAADVHGKNQFLDLNFKEHVLFLKLFHPDMGFIYCDRQNEPELFNLSCGGFGLTGIIVSIGIQLGRLTSNLVHTETIRIEDIFQLPKLLKERSETEELLYSWHDFNSIKNWGSGFVKVGRFKESVSADGGELINSGLQSLLKTRNFSADSRGRIPFNLLNRYTIKLINAGYPAKELQNSPQTLSLSEFLFPILNKTAYFELFGKKGFHETQVLIPTEKFEFVIRDIQRIIKKHSMPVTLASCKLFKGKSELLRFIGTGIVLAMNLPRCSPASAFLKDWDEIVMANLCVPNLTKDSRLPLNIVKGCYPDYEEFKGRLSAWDSTRRFQTSLSQRLEL